MSRLVRIAGVALVLVSFAVQAQAPPVAGTQTQRLQMTYHGISPSLVELARNPVEVAPGMGQRIEPEMDELYEEPLPPTPSQPLAQPFVQTATPKPFAAVAGVSFEGPGTGLTGFTMTGAPPDMTLAVGPNHIVAWVNSQYAVFSKTGTVLLPPVNGNSLFTGLGNECATTNRGDPILQYDRLADRWILSQFAFPTNGSGTPIAPYLQCFAISTTSSPLGTYHRYAVTFGSTSPNGFNDYGKLGVWPDGYYTAYNIFGGTPAGGNTGAAMCVSERVKMLAGDPTASTLCAPVGFYGGGAAFLPADLDGTTLSSDLSQGGVFLRVSASPPALRIIKLKPNFAASTVTLNDGFGGAAGSVVSLTLPATTNACNGTGGTCVAQPGTGTLLDTLGSRLMYRLAFRNRAGVESMVVTHTVDPDGAGARGAALRWYEIRNPLGNPNDLVVANRPFIYQNGTFDPGASGNRWMGSIAMDQYGNIMAGYSVVNAATSLRPSIAIAGREVGDPLNTLQSEIIALTGTGVQTGTLTRWGDYSTIQVDPVDDRTFWYIGQYLSTDGSFNWRTRIVSYGFPPPTSLSINDVNIVEGNSGTSNAVFTITRSNTTTAVSVQVDTANGSATAGSDYVAVVGQVVNFAGGALTATVAVPINGDTVLEADETFTVNLSNAVNAVIGDGVGDGVILNDDSASIAINNRALAEGNSGTTNFVFTVTLTGAVQGGFTVPFSTADGSANQPSDYASTSGTLTFAGTAGEIQTITVPVVGDTIVEANETFAVNLGAPSNAAVTVSAGTGTGTINNDDSATIAIGNRTLNEGNSGTTSFVFGVTLTGAVQGGFTVPFSTANGSASAPSDYATSSGTLTFTGSPAETRNVTIAVVGDLVPEIDENFFVNLGAPSVAAVSASTAQGVGLIINDDLFADIAVTVSNGANAVVGGLPTTYAVVVSNTSTVIDVAAVNIAQTVTAGLSGATWTCTGSGTATCPASGSGVLAQTLPIPRSSSLNFQVTVAVGAGAASPAGTTVIATVQAPHSDPNTSNNTAIDSDVVLADGVFADGFE